MRISDWSSDVCSSDLTPVGSDRLARKDRAAFAGGVVANREDEIELGCTWFREFIPAFRVQAFGRIAEVSQHFDRHRMNITLGLTASAVGSELAFAHPVHQRFAQNRARRITGAEKQYVVDLEIGRASCRGSVGQCVLINEVGVSLKKPNNIAEELE